MSAFSCPATAPMSARDIRHLEARSVAWILFFPTIPPFPQFTLIHLSGLVIWLYCGLSLYSQFPIFNYFFNFLKNLKLILFLWCFIQHSTFTESFYQRITEKLVMKSVPILQFSWRIPVMNYVPSLKEEINAH